MAKHIASDIYTRIYIYVLNKIILEEKVKRNLIKFLHSIWHEMVWSERGRVDGYWLLARVVEWKVKFASNRFAGGFVVHLLFVCPCFCVCGCYNLCWCSWILMKVFPFYFFSSLYILQRKLNYTSTHEELLVEIFNFLLNWRSNWRRTIKKKIIKIPVLF